MENKWLDVDIEGLQQVFPKQYIVRELIANMWDEMKHGANVGKITIRRDNDDLYEIIAQDNSPKGFKDLTDSYTLFRYTDKRKDPTVRGRFNSGDKYVLAHSISAVIMSTTGKYEFNADGTRHFFSNEFTKEGSLLYFLVKLEEHELNDILRSLRYYIQPKGFKLILNLNGNEQPLGYDERVGTAEAVLTSWFIGEKDAPKIVPRRRTTINIYKKKNRRDPSFIYEMGIPVQEIDDPYSYDIQQKIPLDQNREMVKDSYLREVRGACLNVLIDELNDEELSEPMVNDATESDHIDDETLDKIIQRKYPNAIIKSNDPYANEKARDAGYELISGREFSKKVRERALDVGALSRTNEQFKTTFDTADRLSRREVDNNMKRVETLAKRLARRILSEKIVVEFINDPSFNLKAGYVNKWGVRTLTFNVANLVGRQSWFRVQNENEILKLIFHELAHEFTSNDASMHHYSKEYVDGVAYVHFKAFQLVRDEPELFDLKRY